MISLSNSIAKVGLFLILFYTVNAAAAICQNGKFVSWNATNNTIKYYNTKGLISGTPTFLSNGNAQGAWTLDVNSGTCTSTSPYCSCCTTNAGGCPVTETSANKLNRSK